MFRKFAAATIVDKKWSASRVANKAAYRKLADFQFNDYLTNDGFLYVRVRAISSRTNKNHDSWPASELQKAYRTFIGKPVFVDHHNHDPKRARGVVVDAEVFVNDDKTASLDPYYSSADVDPLHLPATHVELLLEIDANRFPKLARALISGEIDSVSMGADVGYTVCSHCGNKAEDPTQFCRHIVAKGAYFDYYKPDGTKTSRRSYEHCYKVAFFELSCVFDPADETALINNVKQAALTPRRSLQALVKEAGVFDQESEDTQYDDPELSGASPEQGHSTEAEQVKGWRYEQLLRMGYPAPLAEEIAAKEYRGPGAGIDIHGLEGLINKGADPETAYQIVARQQRTAAKKLADNPSPQSDMTKMPETIDTLRQEDVCQICGSTMEDGECQLCGYTEPPEGFNNPDLSKAKEVDQQLHQQGQGNQDGQMDQANEVEQEDVAGAASQMNPTVSKYIVVTTSFTDSPTVRNEGKVAASMPQRVNTQEIPLLPISRQNSDKPLAIKTVKDPTQPRESHYMKIKTADGASPLGGQGIAADERVDVEGVGAVTGDPLSDIKSESVDKDTGDFTAPHTETWSGDEGDSLGQHEPVTSEAFEGAGGNGNSEGNAVGVSSPPGHSASVVEANKYVKKSGDKWVIVQKGTGKVLSHHDSEAEAQGAFEAMEANKHAKTADASGDLGGPIGEDAAATGAADSGTSADKPSAPGFPDSSPSRVDVASPLAEEIGDRTKTFGSDDFHITEPITKGNDANDLGGPIGVKASSFGFAVKAMKLAEAEAQLGWVDNKWVRVAELENKSEDYINAQLEAIEKAHTASTKRTASTKTAATRMPSLQPHLAAVHESVAIHDGDIADSLSW